MELHSSKIFDYMNIKESYKSKIKLNKITNGTNIRLTIPYERDINLNVYKVSPGVALVNDNSVVLERYIEHKPIFEFEEPEEILDISCILSGQRQVHYGPDRYMFLQEGDINIYREDKNRDLLNYIGKIHILHIMIDKKIFLENNNDEYYKQMIIDLFEIADVYQNLIFTANEDLLRVLEDIKNFKSKNPENRTVYSKIKALELIFLIHNMELHDEKHNRHTYTDAQIRVVRKIKNSLSRDIANYVSLDVLSISYGINLTSLKNCFRDMYGKPLYTWYREYKFHRAKELIQNTNYPISKIANMIGYKSSSKFTKAFKKEMGVLPSSYRKNKNKKK